QLADVLVGRAFAQSQTLHFSPRKSIRFFFVCSYFEEAYSTHYDKSTSTRYLRKAAQRRHTPVAGACFLYLIADEEEDRLTSPLCAATPTHPCCTGAVCTLLNGRLRFCSLESSTFIISV